MKDNEHSSARAEVNRVLLKRAEYWQKEMTAQLLCQYPDFKPSSLNCITQQIILSVLWLFLCKQRSILAPGILHALQQGDRVYLRLLELLHQISLQLGQQDLFNLSDCLNLNDTTLSHLITDFCAITSSSPLLPSEILGYVYERTLAGGIYPSSCSARFPSVAKNKKTNGIYYTPVAVVQYMVQNTVGLLLNSSSSVSCPPDLRVLDPACGGGAFLVAAYQYLVDWYSQHKQRSLTQAEREQVLLQHIYGVDLDPQAIAVTTLSLGLKLLESLPAPIDRPLPDLSRNIQCGNTLVNVDCWDILSIESCSTLNAFDWTQAFPDIMQTGGFDVVIGNPPYLDSEWMTNYLPDWRKYCDQRYRTATGNWDLFCVFVEKAIDLCQPQGLTSLIVPNKLASADYAGQVRRMLAQDNQLLSIRDYSQVPVFSASVYPLVYIAQKTTRQPNSVVQYELMQTLNQVSQSRSLQLHQTNPEHSWFLNADDRQLQLICRLQQDFPTLGTIADVTGAATVGEAYLIQPLIQECQPVSPEDLQFINSGTIDRYRLLWGQKPLRYLGHTYWHPVILAAHRQQLPTRRYQQAIQPKIIVASMTQNLECAIDGTGSVLAGKSTTVIRLKETEVIDLRYLLGLLNSQLLNFYFKTCFSGNCLQGGYFRIGPPQLKTLPICVPSLNHPAVPQAYQQECYQQVISLVDQRLTLQQQALDRHDSIAAQTLQQTIDQIDRTIDQLIYHLYNLTEAEISAIRNQIDR